MKLRPCPFCGSKMEGYLLYECFRPCHSDEYLIEKLKHGHFLGGENGYEVFCPNCGGRGPSDTCATYALDKWNGKFIDLSWKGE